MLLSNYGIYIKDTSSHRCLLQLQPPIRVCEKCIWSQYPSQLRGPATPTPDPNNNCQFVSLIPRHPAQHLMHKAQGTKAHSTKSRSPKASLSCVLLPGT